MRCRTCDYPLWDLPARRCPECGRDFAPSSYEFTPNSVEWCCPHCAQAYFGTGPRGGLQPPEFECVRCGTMLHMDDMVLRLPAGVGESDAMPMLGWLRRREVGRIRAWFETVGSALVRPGAMMRRVPERARLRSAVGFAVVTQVLAGMLAMIPILTTSGFAASRVSQMSAGALPIALQLATSSVVAVVLLVVGSVVGPLLWGTLAHGILLVTGGTPHGTSRTLQSVLYASGASLVNAVPCIGGYVGWLWWVVSSVIAVKSAQRTSTARAVVAVGLPPVLVLLLVLGSFLALVFGAARAATTALTAASSEAAAESSASAAADAVSRWRVADGSTALRHPLELVVDWGMPAPLLSAGSLDVALAVDPESAIADADALDRFEREPDDARRAAVDRAVESLPADWVAQRSVDLVLFRRPEGSPREDRADAWLLAIAPRFGAGPSGQFDFIVVQVDGAVQPIRSAEAEVRVRAENARRLDEGLQPLPEPRLVEEGPLP